MSESFVLIDLGVIALAALVFGIAASRLRQSSSLGYIVAGVALGPLVLRYLVPGEGLSPVFGELGIIMILFYLGLELNLKRIREAGAIPFVMAAGQMVFAFSAGFITGKLFGLSDIAAAVCGAVIICTSTVMVARFILDRNMMQEVSSRIALSILMLQDFFGIFTLVFISSLSMQKSLNIFVLNALLFIIAMFFLVSKASRHVLNFLHSLGHGDKMVFYAIGIGVVSAFVGAELGLSTTLGAYFAGFALAESAYGDRIKRELGVFREFFILFFFVSFGATLFYNPLTGTASIPAFAQLLPIIFLAAALTVAYLVSSALAFFSTGTLFGLDKNTISGVNALLVPLGEFVIIIVTAASPILPPPVLDIILPTSFLLILFTAPLGPLLFDARKQVADIYSSLMPKSIEKTFASSHKRIAYASHLLNNPVLQDQYVQSVGRMIRNLVIAFSIVYIGVLLRHNLQDAGSTFLPGIPGQATVGFILLLVVTWPLYKFVSELRFLVEVVSRSMLRSTFPAVARSSLLIEDEVAEVFTGLLLTSIGLSATVAIYYAFPNELLYLVVPVAFTMLSLMHLSRSFYALIEHFDSFGEFSNGPEFEPETRDDRILGLTKEFEDHARQFRTLHNERERLKERVRDALHAGNIAIVRSLLTQFKRREEKLMRGLSTPRAQSSHKLMKLVSVSDTRASLETYLLRHAQENKRNPRHTRH